MKLISNISRYENFKNFSQKSGEIFDNSIASKILNQSSTESASTLSRWNKQGLIFRISQGFYALVPVDASSKNFTLEDPWILAPKLFGECYVGGVSALEYWDLTEQIFNKILIFTTKKVRKMEIQIAGQNFSATHIQKSQLFGLSVVWRKQTKVMISDIHRTLLDAFNDPSNGGGIQHSVDCLKKYLQREEADLKKLEEYAIKLNNGAVFKRLGYLFSVFLGENHPITKSFKSRITKGYSYLDPKQKMEVKLVTDWNLFVPQSFAEDKIL